jgi:hypothetical protein
MTPTFLLLLSMTLTVVAHCQKDSVELLTSVWGLSSHKI